MIKELVEKGVNEELLTKDINFLKSIGLKLFDAQHSGETVFKFKNYPSDGSDIYDDFVCYVSNYKRGWYQWHFNGAGTLSLEIGTVTENLGAILAKLRNKRLLTARKLILRAHKIIKETSTLPKI